MAQRAEPIDLGFTVADAESPEMRLTGQHLVVAFSDWKAALVHVEFSDVIALRWQEAEYYLDDAERFDSVYLIHDSEWLAEHERQGIPWAGSQHRHLKLNFNAAGILEVLCTDVAVQ